jgi:signal transduction histidine kinase
MRPEGIGERTAPRSRSAADQKLKTLEAACEAMRKRLDEAERTSGELVSTITHDLRNPLSVVLVSVKMLSRALPGDHPNRRHLDAITRAADEMNQMLQDVSDASSIERGCLAVSRDPLPLGEILERALGAVRAAATSKSLALDEAAASEMPSVLVEHDRIVRVLTHLLINAIKFTPKGGSVGVQVEPRAHDVLLRVVDTGPGIAEEQRDHLFARNSGSRRPMSQGTGLGLFVAKGIVEAHGGRVWVESEPGHGARFCFTLLRSNGAETPSG